MKPLTKKQREARNEAFQLLTVATRILKDAGFTAYAYDAQMLVTGIYADAKMEADQYRMMLDRAGVAA